MQTRCQCSDDDIPDYKQVPLDSSRRTVYGVNFRNIPINNIKFKLASIKAPAKIKEPCNFVIRKDARINPIYEVFKLNKYNGKLEPNKSTDIKVRFQPNVAMRFNETFEIWYWHKCQAVIQCIGVGIAPNVEISRTEVWFFTFEHISSPIAHITLKNKSEAPAIFQVDIDECQEIFNVQSPLNGTILPMNTRTLHIKFKPKEEGIFSIQVPILISYSSPIIVTLIGICSTDDIISDPINYSMYEYPERDMQGYNAYLRNWVNRKQYVPPISLSRMYISFGTVQVVDALHDEIRSSTEVFSLTNHMNDPVRVYWLLDDPVFIISPKMVIVPSNESVNFECKFQPREVDTMYSRILRAQVIWKKDYSNMVIPISISIRVIGTSFTKNEILCNARVVPPLITLPPCIPNKSVKTTFIIENSGTLPLMFKFIPPQNTMIVLKPPVGILATFQMLVIQFFMDSMQEKTLTEQWTLILNDNCEKYFPVYIRVECCIPNITIGDGNKVHFGVVQEKGQKMQNIRIRNNTIFPLRFEFLCDNKNFFHLLPRGGTIRGYDETYVNMCYQGKPCAKRKFIETVRLWISQSKKFKKFYIDKKFYVYGEHKYSQLFTDPAFLDFGQLPCGSNINTSFQLINMGDSVVHYYLYVSEKKNHSAFHNMQADKFVICPAKATIHPGEKIIITIDGTAHAMGMSFVKISYANRMDVDLDILDGHEFVDVFVFRYNCSYPTLQVLEILNHDLGPLFSKTLLWEYLQINKLNEILFFIRVNETKELYVQLPQMEIDPKKYRIILLMKNTTIFETGLECKRKKNCDCKLQTNRTETYWLKRIYNCPHRDMINIHWEQKENQYIFLYIDIKYLVEGTNHLSFYLELSQKRKILINFHMSSVLSSIWHISSYTKDFTMNLIDVYIGDKDPMFQLFWLYNVTQEIINYELDVTLLDDECRVEDFTIIKCINAKGFIKPKSNLPLIFKFHPIEARIHEFILPLKLGNQHVDFKIIGNGINNPIVSTKHFDTEMPIYNKGIIKTNVTLSIEHLVLDIFPVWFSLERIIFINNYSDSIVFRYEFQDFVIPHLIEIKAINNGSGELLPNNSQAVTISFASLGEPFTSWFIIYFKIENICEEKLYIKNMDTYNQFKSSAKCKVAEEEDLKNVGIEKPVPPEHFYLNIHVGIYTISTADKDSYMNALTQFKYISGDKFSLNVENIIKHFDHLKRRKPQEIKFYKEDIPRIVLSTEAEHTMRTTLECIIADIVFSKVFDQLVATSENQVSPIYNRFRVDKKVTQGKERKDPEKILSLRKEETKKLFCLPPLDHLSKVLENAIYDSVKAFLTENSEDAFVDRDTYVKQYINEHICKEICKCEK